MPMINILGYGILPLPMTKIVCESVRKYCKDSPYGLGEETLIDKKVRKSIQIDPKYFSIDSSEFASKVDQLIQSKVKKDLGLDDKEIYGILYKLLIYERGGKFDEHKDTEKHDNMFGTLIIQLPSIFSGGDLVVKHNKQEKVFKNSLEGSNSQCVFVAHFASCPHALQTITSGYRVALVYSLCWNGLGKAPAPCTINSSTQDLCVKLNRYMGIPGASYLVWALDFEYSDASISKKSEDIVQFFKGNDRSVLTGVKAALDCDRKESGHVRYKFYVATANLKIKDSGECGFWEGGWGSGWHMSCNGKCRFEVCETIKTRVSLNELKPLSENTDPARNLKIPLNAKNLINYETKTGKNTGDSGFNEKGKDGFWVAKDFGSGCSGPSGNEGATRDKWYKKRVLVLWREDHDFSITCRSDFLIVIRRMQNLIQNEKIEEAKRLAKDAMSSGLTLNESESISLLDVCNHLESKELILYLLKLLVQFGISSTRTASVLAATVSSFPEEEVKHYFHCFIKNCGNARDFDNLFNCLQNIKKGFTHEEIILMMIDSRSFRNYYYNSGASRQYSSSNDPITLILSYMNEKQVFPEEQVNVLISSISDVSRLLSLLSTVAKNNSVFQKKICDRIGFLVKEGHPDHLERYIDSSLKLIETMENNKNFGTANRLLESIINYRPLNQTVVKWIAKYVVTKKMKKNVIMSDSLKEVCLLRLKYLEQIVSAGEPQLTWNQPEAIHEVQEIQTFLRGPNEKLIYKNFEGIPKARAFANRHDKLMARLNVENPSFKMTLGNAKGKEAFVVISKTTAAHEDKLREYYLEVKEYKKVASIVPGYLDVTLKREEKRAIKIEDCSGSKIEPMISANELISAGQQALCVNNSANVPSASTMADVLLFKVSP